MMITMKMIVYRKGTLKFQYNQRFENGHHDFLLKEIYEDVVDHVWHMDVYDTRTLTGMKHTQFIINDYRTVLNRLKRDVNNTKNC